MLDIGRPGGGLSSTGGLSSPEPAAKPKAPRVRDPLIRARWFRALLLIPGGIAMLAGLNAGLQRLDVAAPVSNGRVASAHGMLMVLGFVGTLIALERSVAANRRWAFCSPVLLGLGGIALISPLPRPVGYGLLLAGSLAMIVVYIPLYRRQRDASVAVQILGAVLATGGSLLVLREVSFPLLLPWMAGFVILTIAGERLELAKVAMLVPTAASSLLTIVAAYCAATALTLVVPTVGYPLLGASLLSLTVWLARFDVAMKTVRGTGLPRFTAACLLAGYAWLAVAGMIWLLSTGAPDGSTYDAVVHSVFLGFTISMVMAHAPIILPAVLRRPLPYSAAFYVPAALLQLSLLIRVLFGDGFGSTHARDFGGVLNVVSLLLFALIAIAVSILKAERS